MESLSYILILLLSVVGISRESKIKELKKRIEELEKNNWFLSYQDFRVIF